MTIIIQTKKKHNKSINFENDSFLFWSHIYIYMYVFYEISSENPKTDYYIISMINRLAVFPENR